MTDGQNRLNREKKEREEVNADLLTKCVELQMLKFGRIVDVDAMQESRINEPAEELKVAPCHHHTPLTPHRRS